MDKEYTVLEVGKPFELFYGRNMKGQSGCIFEQLSDGTMCLVVYLDGMTPQETIVLRNEKIRARVVKYNNFITMLFRYGNTPLIFELSFDPTLYKDERLGAFKKSNLINIIGVDSNTNIIKTLRLVSIPMPLYQLLVDTWSSAFETENYSEKYTKWQNKLLNYSLPDLWKVAEDYGELGK